MSNKSISKAIIAVMQQVRGIEKNARVGSGNSAYDGTKDKDVKEAFSVALADNGLCIVPTSIEEETDIQRWTEDTQWGAKQKQSVFTKVRTKYLLIHESGESIELAGYGHGVDPQDKAAGKALTYALKNTLLYTFLTPVGKIDDADATHSNDVATPPAAPAPKITWDSWVIPFGKNRKGQSLGEVVMEGAVDDLRAIRKYLTELAKKKEGTESYDYWCEAKDFATIALQEAEKACNKDRADSETLDQKEHTNPSNTQGS